MKNSEGTLGIVLQRFREHRKSMMNMGYYLMASFIPMLINLFLSPLYSLNLSADDFAIVGYYASFQALFGPLILFDLNQYYMREYYFRNEEERETLRSTLFNTFLVIPFIVVLLSLFGLYVYLKISGAATGIPFFPYAILTFLPWALAGIYRLDLIDCKVQRKAKKYFGISIANSAILIISTIIFVVFFKWGATGKLIGAFIPALVMFLWSFIRHKETIKAEFDWNILKIAFLFCAPLVLADTMDFFSGGYDKVFLQKYVSLEQLGLYTIGLSIASYLGIFSSAMGETFNPDIYSSIANKDNKRAIKFVLIQVFIMSIIVVVFILFAKYAILLLTAGRYVDSTPFARITSLAAITGLTRGLVTPFIYSAKKTKVVLWAKIFSSIAAVITYSLLIKKHGLYGASWGYVICPLFFSSFALFFFKYRWKTPLMKRIINKTH